jgi:hypothetical protein
VLHHSSQDSEWKNWRDILWSLYIGQNSVIYLSIYFNTCTNNASVQLMRTIHNTCIWRKVTTWPWCKQLRGLSPWASYTDRAIAACPRSKCELFRIEAASWSAQRIPYSRNLGFLDQSRYFFFQAAPQLYSRGRVDPVPDPLLLRKSRSAANRTRTSGSVAMNSNHYHRGGHPYVKERIILRGIVKTGWKCADRIFLVLDRGQQRAHVDNVPNH